MSHSKKKLDLNKPVKLIKPVVGDRIVEVLLESRYITIIYKDSSGFKGKRYISFPRSFFGKNKIYQVTKPTPFTREVPLYHLKKKNSKRSSDYVIPDFLLENVNGVITKINMYGGRKW